MRVSAFAAALVLAAVPPLGARTASAKPPPLSKAPSRPAAVPQGPPAADVRLVIEAPTVRGAWTMRVINAGAVPVIITADARLLTLEVTPRSSHVTRDCELPSDMRPEGDLQRPLVLPPGREYAESFEPRLYCLSGVDLDALAPQSIVVARLGWSGHGQKPPLEVGPIDGVTPAIAPLRAIESQPFALPDEPTAPPEAHPENETESSEPAELAPHLELSSPDAVDADSPDDVEIPITLRNTGTRAAVVRFRPETLRFTVLSLTGDRPCPWPAAPSAPTRGLFTTLRPRETTTITIKLPAYCPDSTFHDAGLLAVKPVLDTRHASGASIALRTFDGEVIGASTTWVRLRHGRVPAPLVHPQLVPQVGER